MEKKAFDSWVETFLSALRENRLLIIIDSSSKGDKAEFRLVAYDNGFFYSCAAFLRELGFNPSKRHSEQFVFHCAGRYSWFILDYIGRLLSERVEDFNEKEYYALIGKFYNVM